MLYARCYGVWWRTIVGTRQNDAAVAPSVCRDFGRPGGAFGNTSGTPPPRSFMLESMHIGNVVQLHFLELIYCPPKMYCLREPILHPYSEGIHFFKEMMMHRHVPSGEIS